MQERLALFDVDLDGLIAKETVDVGIPAIRADAAGDDERLDARGRVAGGGASGPDEMLEGLLLIGLVERGALERPELGANAHRPEIVDDGLGGGRVDGVG